MTSEKRPRSRVSLAYVPTAEALVDLLDSENAGANMTTALEFDLVKSNAAAREKRARSKSLGPGGLVALREDSGNRVKLPKSILKPAVSLSPLRPIPPRKAASPGKKARSPGRTNGAIQVPQSPETTRQEGNRGNGVQAQNGASPKLFEGLFTTLGNSFRKNTTVTNHEEQEETEEQKRKRLRDARRKSLAARRVSFAPEATVHHFAEIEENQDSTTSSASTNPSRRGSNMSDITSQNLARQDFDLVAEHPPSTPPEQVEEKPEATSPAHQRDLHQKKHRRGSTDVARVDTEGADDVFSSSPSNGSPPRLETSAPNLLGSELNEEQDDQDDDEEEDDLFQKLDAGHTGRWQRIDVGAGAEANKSPNQSAAQATEDLDEDGEMSMELAGDEVTAAFKPWVQRLFPIEGAPALPPNTEQENVNPFSPAFKSSLNSNRSDIYNSTMTKVDDATMEVTRAVGGIISVNLVDPIPTTTKKSPKRRKSVLGRRRSSGVSSVDGGETMDFTTALGVVQTNSLELDSSEADQNEELSMEFTSVFGGINGRNPANPAKYSTEAVTETAPSQAHAVSPTTNAGEMEMDMTRAWGGPKSQNLFANEDQVEGDDMDMDMTVAVGNIIVNDIPREEMQKTAPVFQEVVEVVTATSPLRSRSATKTRPHQLSMAESDAAASQSIKPSDDSFLVSPQKLLSTPQKQITPRPVRSVTPSKTPPSRNVSMRMPSPKKLFQEQSKKLSTVEEVAQGKDLSSGRDINGPTPNVAQHSAPKLRKRLSGVGADKPGLGSPRVTALFERRTSLADKADLFALPAVSVRSLQYADPKLASTEVTRSREEEARRESGQYIMEMEAGADLEEKDATATLKDMITSMTPKKDKANPRKSLATGSARGLLGKRPAELDEDDEEDGTPKSLKGRQTSPVKRIRLRGPPSKLETTGRADNVHMKSHNDAPITPSITFSASAQVITTPRDQSRFKNVEASRDAGLPLSPPGHLVAEKDNEAKVDAQDEAEKIHLQDFLNLTNIRFMELNTTKRRNTIAPNAHATMDGESVDEDKLFEDCIVAGACTMPLIELYQHSCRELRKYIHEGREIVREIEADTFEENPPLFREYMSASPAERAVMDDQFRNMKIHARLLSKGTWYEWRMKLLEGLKEGLGGHLEGMQKDDAVLSRQEKVIEPALAAARAENVRLEVECATLRKQADQFPECDREELRVARIQLGSLNEQVLSKKKAVAELKAKLDTNKIAIGKAQAAKTECQEIIKEAQRIREACRGWSVAEVATLKAKVDAIEAEHGWIVTGASATALTMTYQRQLELFFDTAAFLPAASLVTNAKSAPISLTYIDSVSKEAAEPLTTEKRFFLQLMRAHLQCLEQRQTQVSDLLQFVSRGWTKALEVATEVKLLSRSCITKCSIVSDECLEVRATMLLADLKTKVEVKLDLTASGEQGEVVATVKPSARVIYGETFREDRMHDFLLKRVVEGRSWADMFEELKGRLVASRKKN